MSPDPGVAEVPGKVFVSQTVVGRNQSGTNGTNMKKAGESKSVFANKTVFLQRKTILDDNF